MNVYRRPDDTDREPAAASQMPDTAPAPAADRGVRTKKSLNVVVTGLGTASTVATLFLVEIIRGWQFDPMLFFVNYVIPAGAVGVGLVAGTGYALGSWVTQARLSRPALWYIAFLHTLAWGQLYLAAWWHWQAGGHGGAHSGLFEWFDTMTRSMAWQGRNGHAGEPFGVFGYLVRLGELIGFVGGGLIIPAALFAKPYCDACQRYLKERTLFSLPAAAEHRGFVRQKTLDAANQPVLQRLTAQMDALDAAITAHDGDGFRALVEGVADQTASNRKIRQWFIVSRHRCPGCGAGCIDFSSSNANNLQRLKRFPVDGTMLEAADDVATRLPQLREQAKSAATKPKDA
jgi:hypothetical protein